jgi:hypothetical protein
VAVAERAGSWADWLSDRVDRSSVPTPFAVGAAGAALLLGFESVVWASGAMAIGTVRPIHVLFAFLVPGLPWLVGIFNRSAARAVRRAAPLVERGPERAAALEADIVLAPRLLSVLPAILFVPVAVTRFSLEPRLMATVGFDPLPGAIWALAVLFALVALAVSAYAVKIATLAYKVHRITVDELRVELWHTQPLLSFSILTARMAGATVVLLTVFVLAAPELYTDAFGIAGLGLAATLLVTVFALPLLGLHGRLTRAKQAAQSDAARQMEDAIERLRTALAANDLAVMDPINKAIGAVDVAQKAIDRIPTWPWSIETFRWVVGALMFPVVIFVTQAVLGRVLGR